MDLDRTPLCQKSRMDKNKKRGFTLLSLPQLDQPPSHQQDNLVRWIVGIHREQAAACDPLRPRKRRGEVELRLEAHGRALIEFTETLKLRSGHELLRIIGTEST